VIRPGMFARGHIVTGVSRDTMLIPKDAVEERRGSKMVFVVETKREVRKGKEKTVSVSRRHDIEVINENTEFVDVKQPVDLKPGDVVVTKGRQNLQEGSKLSINGSK
jgi:multidrug efflux pump subunit AcrA (membrane-fusion protein)